MLLILLGLVILPMFVVWVVLTLFDLCSLCSLCLSFNLPHLYWLYSGCLAVWFIFTIQFMHACHSFLAHPSVRASHFIPAFHLDHVHLFNYASLWIMLVNCFMLVLQFCLSFSSCLLFCSCFLCALYSLLTPSPSSGFYLPLGLYSCLLSCQLFGWCLSFCLCCLSSGMCLTISFHSRLPLTSSCLPFTSCLSNHSCLSLDSCNLFHSCLSFSLSLSFILLAVSFLFLI